MPFAPQIISLYKGATETFTIKMAPPQSVDGWALEFRAKTSVVNPDERTKTILYEDVGADATEIVVSSAVGFPYEGEFKIRIDNEVMQVTTGPAFYANGRLNVRWVVERGVHGTTAAVHTMRSRITLFNQPQLLMDNGSQGGVVVTDVDLGWIDLRFDGTFTSERPTGTYFWVLRRTDAGYERPLAGGLIYLMPSVLSTLLEPPVHR